MYSFGELLRSFRKDKKLSQLELAIESGVSSKHLSFLETGRSNPSRDVISTISSILDLSSFQKNLLLTAAGYMRETTIRDISDREQKNINNALLLIVENHNPYPAIIVDRNWNVILGNKSFQMLMARLLAIEPTISSSSNIMELIFDPKGLKPFISNWHEVAYACLQRLHREELACRGLHGELLNLIRNVHGYTIEINYRYSPKSIICFELSICDASLKFLTTLTSFATPTDAGSDNIMIEHYYPMDESTKLFFEIEQGNIHTESVIRSRSFPDIIDV